MPSHEHDQDDTELKHQWVDAISKAMAAVKFALLRKIDRAIATAAFALAELVAYATVLERASELEARR